MTSLGTIFMYDKNLRNLYDNASLLRARGFIAFGTDNLYRLMKYAEKVMPDLVLLSIPPDFTAEQITFDRLEQSLCAKTCPQVYTNAAERFSNTSAFHPYTFSDAPFDPDEIFRLLHRLPHA